MWQTPPSEVKGRKEKGWRGSTVACGAVLTESAAYFLRHPRSGASGWGLGARESRAECSNGGGGLRGVWGVGGGTSTYLG